MGCYRGTLRELRGMWCAIPSDTTKSILFGHHVSTGIGDGQPVWSIFTTESLAHAEKTFLNHRGTEKNEDGSYPGRPRYPLCVLWFTKIRSCWERICRLVTRRPLSPGSLPDCRRMRMGAIRTDLTTESGPSGVVHFARRTSLGTGAGRKPGPSQETCNPWPPVPWK